MTAAEILHALRHGKTVTAIDRDGIKIIKSAFKKKGDRVICADYVSDDGEHYTLSDRDKVCELRLDDSVISICRLQRDGSDISAH